MTTPCTLCSGTGRLLHDPSYRCVMGCEEYASRRRYDVSENGVVYDRRHPIGRIDVDASPKKIILYGESGPSKSTQARLIRRFTRGDKK